MTGRYPASTRVHQNGNDSFPDEEILVSRMFADSGYVSGLIGKLHLSRGDILEKRPKNDGYSFYKWSHHSTPDYPSGHDYADWLKQKGVDPAALYGKLQGAVGAGVPDEFHQTTWCTEVAIEFIQDHTEEPWFLNINPFDPHPPYDPPEEYLKRYSDKELPPPIFREEDILHQEIFSEIDQQARRAINPFQANEGENSVQNIKRADLGSYPPEHFSWKDIKACYYAMIEKIDDSLGKIVKALEESGQLDNTIIIFTSDHGELLGDHGLIYKGCRFFEALTHVPLIISWPEGFARDYVSNMLVELVDIVPTVLEAAGIPVPYYVQGKSLASFLTAPTANYSHKDHVICEYHGAIGGPQMPDQTHGVMFYDGRYKVSVYAGHSIGEIYDLEADPEETHNLWFDDNFLAQKADLVQQAFSGYLGTVDTGIERTGLY